jgi:hypothetical protein
LSMTEKIEEATAAAGAKTTDARTTDAERNGAEATGLQLDAEVRSVQERLRSASNRLAAAATALGPLTRAAAYEDLKKLRATVERVEERLPAEVRREAGLEELLGRVRGWVDEAGERRRRRLGKELQAACADVGLDLRVVSRESPVEVRIPPFAVVLDFEKGQAVLKFARLEVARAPAEAAAILAAHAKARRDLETGFDPQRFFTRCHRAWRAARAAKGDSGERIEILDCLPYLAVEMQSPRFRVEPTGENFRGYGRARFAWDVLRLRQARMLTQDGLRMNLGVATGATASQKKRVLYFEDEDGNGEYKLTLFFTRVEGSGE